MCCCLWGRTCSLQWSHQECSVFWGCYSFFRIVVEVSDSTGFVRKGETGIKIIVLRGSMVLESAGNRLFSTEAFSQMNWGGTGKRGISYPCSSHRARSRRQLSPKSVMLLRSGLFPREQGKDPCTDWWAGRLIPQEPPEMSPSSSPLVEDVHHTPRDGTATRPCQPLVPSPAGAVPHPHGCSGCCCKPLSFRPNV